jgi:hypothetical protein
MTDDARPGVYATVYNASDQVTAHGFWEADNRKDLTHFLWAFVEPHCYARLIYGYQIVANGDFYRTMSEPEHLVIPIHTDEGAVIRLESIFDPFTDDPTDIN